MIPLRIRALWSMAASRELFLRRKEAARLERKAELERKYPEAFKTVRGVE